MATYHSSRYNETIINAVRQRPCLYDVTHINYTQTEIKKNNWEDLAQDLGIDVFKVKSTWKGLRDTFRKKKSDYERRISSGSEDISEPRWSGWSMMTWLSPYLREGAWVRVNNDGEQLASNTIVAAAAGKSRNPLRKSDTDISVAVDAVLACKSGGVTLPSITPGRSPRRLANQPSSATNNKRRKVDNDDKNNGLNDQQRDTPPAVIIPVATKSAEQRFSATSAIMSPTTKSSEQRFGEEVAEQLLSFENDYQRETVKRQIRDLLYYGRFPQQTRKHIKRLNQPPH